jgi:hypothetical protein
LENENDPVSQNFNAILKPSLDLLMLFAVSIILPQWFVKRIPCNANSVLPEKVGYLRNLFSDILREKRAQIAQEKTQQEAAEGDILGTMMRGGEFSDSELVDQMLTFLAAGVCLVLPKNIDLPEYTKGKSNEDDSMKPQPVPSPGAATISALNQISKRNCARRFTQPSRPPMRPYPGKTSKECHTSMVSAKKSCAYTQQYP